MRSKELHNLDQWAIDNNFIVYKNNFADTYNKCDWYAYRRITLPNRQCDCNNKAVQLVINPYEIDHNGILHQSVQVSITGEVDDIWYKLEAYSLSFNQLITRIDELEINLVRAWNILKPKTIGD